jgi:predicted enzyme related to lactoylglutathione lyase
MGRVTGLGGVFIKSRDPKALGEWYKQHLGIEFAPAGPDCSYSALAWKDDPKTDGGMSVFSVFSQESKHFAPSTSSFMINLRVEDMDGLMTKLSAEGVNIDPKHDDTPYGRFAWVYDPDGNKIELWEPGKEE